MIQIKLNRKNKEVNFDLILKKRAYVDTIFEVAPINFFEGDSLQVTYNLTISGYTDGRETSEIKEKYSYIFYTEKESEVINYIRFTKLRSKANIQIYNKLPGDFYIPKKFNSKKVR